MHLCKGSHGGIVLADFFQLLPIPADAYNGRYDLRLVMLSYMVAVFASYIALDFTGRLRDLNNTQFTSLLWLVSGSIAMGSGIWAMHFIGMLSFTIPGLTLQYDLFWTLISLCVAIIASAFALMLLKSTVINLVHLLAGGVILGLAIASMHYTGMEAMLITLNINYLPGLFFLSILVAIAASEAAIWLALKSNTVVLRYRTRVKIVSSLIMGLAICGMHYIGMSASVFTPLCIATVGNVATLDPTLMAIIIAAVTFIILCVAFFASIYKESINQEQFEKARQLGMAEISASVLHNVGNVLNSVNISTETILQKNADSQITSLQKLCTLLNQHENDLGEFIAKDPRGQKTLYFLNQIAEYWKEEHQWTQNEVQSLIKNIHIIKNIITTQQDLSRIMGTEQTTFVEELLDEAILITGFEARKDIDVQRNYAKVGTIVIDKVKFMQIIVNLLRNAKDALHESNNQLKKLTVKTELINSHTVLIEISDTGIGILPENINKVFNYGFTTKKLGHGFGLHASALAVNELGGEIRVTSEGKNKGVTFTLKIPYKRAGK